MLNASQNSDESDAINLEPSSIELGVRIRSLREAHGISQRKLAQVAGVTNGTISMIEQGRVSPSVASLKKVLSVFGFSLADFFADDFQPEPQIFYLANQLTPLSKGPVRIHQLGNNLARRNIQMLHEFYEPGGDTGELLLNHIGEEAGIVVRGQIEVTVGGVTQVLKNGDGYYFNSRLPHRFRNLSNEVCEIVSSCTPPTF